MKIKQVFHVLLSVWMSVVFITCSSDDPIIPEITVPEGSIDYFEESMDFSSDGGSKLLSFTSNVDWTLVASNTQGEIKWCKISQNSGVAGHNGIIISVEENTSYDDRSLVLVLQAENITKNVVITQEQKNAILLTTNKIEVDAKGTTIDIEVKANIEYNVEIPNEYQDWISQSTKSRVLSSKNISFVIDESTEYNERNGEIYFKSGNIIEVLKVHQKGSTILLLDKESYDVEGSETTISITINSNTDYDVTIADDWISEVTNRALSNNVLNFKIASNKTGNSRIGNINIKTKDELKEVNVIINQAAAIKAESLKLEFYNLSGTIGDNLYIGKDYMLEVSAEPSNAVIDCDWTIENTDIASIKINGNSATISTINYGKFEVVVKDKITGISKSYDFSTCVTDFQFEENSRETQYGYPVIKIAKGSTYQLKCSYCPNYATNVFANLKSFSLKEKHPSLNTYVIVENSSIIDIDKDGLITAKNIGTTIIEAENGDGIYKSGSNEGVFIEVVEELSPYGTIGGHKYVDLGLPSGKLWATENFGGFKDTDYGSYYKWSSDDVVPSSWGNKWSTPTKEEFGELLENCSYSWNVKNGVNGYLFTGKNGAEMFLPAAGFKLYIEGYGYSDIQSEGKGLLYWSSTKSTYTWEGHSFAFVLLGYPESISSNSTYNISEVAAPIRPISR